MDSSTVTEPPSEQFNFLSEIITDNLQSTDIITIIICLSIMAILIILSGTISSTENAFFSLSPTQIDEITESEGKMADSVHYLTGHPKRLLATILLTNTFINIAFVMVSSLLIDIAFDFEMYPILGFVVEVVFITFVIVLFGEVMPKIYASQNNEKVVRLLAVPTYYLYKSLQPFVALLVRSTSIIDKRITKKGHVLSVDELTHAIDITSEVDSPKEEKSILKSIVTFGNTTVKQIMKQRPDIVAIDSNISFSEVLSKINDWGYSRVPVYQNNLDNILGVLYIKDLLPHMLEGDDFKWAKLIRKPYFVPESKKIDDLLKEFQNKRVHVAIVIDEFGGTSGMATMEDILEEIFGEINDEFDEDETIYSKVDNNTYVFEAKILINDMCKYMDVVQERFDEIRNEADTLGGLLLELHSEIPQKDEEIVYDEFKFIIESVDKRRIKRVKVCITPN